MGTPATTIYARPMKLIRSMFDVDTGDLQLGAVTSVTAGRVVELQGVVEGWASDNGLEIPVLFPTSRSPNPKRIDNGNGQDGYRWRVRRPTSGFVRAMEPIMGLCDDRSALVVNVTTRPSRRPRCVDVSIELEAHLGKKPAAKLRSSLERLVAALQEGIGNLN